MRICLLTPPLLTIPPLYGGAIETFSYELGNSLATLNNKVIMITKNGKSTQLKVHPNLSIIPIRIPNNPLFRGIFFNLGLLQRMLKDSSIDIIHTQGSSILLSAYLRSKVMRTPIIHTEHVYYPWIRTSPRSFPQKLKYPIERGLGKITIDKVEKIVVSSRLMENALSRFNEKLRFKLAVIPQGINTNLFDFRISPHLIREKYDILEGEKLFLFVGRIIPEKNIEILVKSIGSVLKINKKFKFLLLGPEEDRFPSELKGQRTSKYLRNIKDWIKKNNLQDNIIFTGPIPYRNIPFYYAAADLLVHPALFETFGRALFEAASMGVPIISKKDTNAALEYLPKSGALFLKNITTSTLAAAIIKFLDEESAFKKLAMDQARFIQKHYDWNKIAELYYNLYSEVL